MLQDKTKLDSSSSTSARVIPLAIMICAGIIAAGLRPKALIAQQSDPPSNNLTDKQPDIAVTIDAVAAEDRANDDLLAGLESSDYVEAERQIANQLGERPNDPDLRYRLAAIRHKLGTVDEALDEMRSLVTDHKYGPAARWIIEHQFNRRRWPDLSRAEREELVSITELLLKLYPNDRPIKNLYVDYLLASGDLAKALPILSDLSDIDSRRGLQAAAVARRLNRNEEADALAERTLESMQTALAEDPNNVSLSLAVAQNQLFLERFAAAIDTLKKATERAATPREQESARTALGDSFVAQIMHIEKNSTGTVAERVRILELLLAALKHAPDNPRVLTTVSNQLLATINEDDEQINELRSLLLERTSPGIRSFIQGTEALMKQDYETAAAELSLAVQQMPVSSAVLNNLAVALTELGYLAKALTIINQAIDIADNPPPPYYETRAQVLMRMERFEQAIPDFKRAIAHPQLKKKAHQDLASCYRQLGDTEAAEAHTKAAEDE